MYDTIIIGAGPAGLTAALYLKRGMKKVLILEALSYGGQIVNTLEIDNYPANEHISGFDFANNLYQQVKKLECEIKFENVLKLENKDEFKEVQTKDNIYKTKTIIIASGCNNRKLGIEKEDELVGKGISYCATCDGAFYREKPVAVVGGGNTAIEDAIYLSDIASCVYVIHRRDTFKAEEKLINILKEKNNVKFICNSRVTKLNGDEKLTSIEVTSSNNQIKKLKIDGLFIAIGRVPESEFCKNIINLDDSGYIMAKEDCHTNIDGIFVAGDVRVKSLRQLVTATSDGAVAATEAINYLNNMCKK